MSPKSDPKTVPAYDCPICLSQGTLENIFCGRWCSSCGMEGPEEAWQQAIELRIEIAKFVGKI